MRSTFEPMLDGMTGHLIKSLQDGVQAANAGQISVQDGSRHSASAPLSSFVYCCSICITRVWRRSADDSEALRDGVLRKSGVLRFVTIPGALRGAPDLVEERFYLRQSLPRLLSWKFVIFAVVGTYPPVGVDGAAGRTREALRGVLHFCGECTAAAVLALKKSGDPLPPAMSSDEPLQARDAPRSQEDVDLARSSSAICKTIARGAGRRPRFGRRAARGLVRRPPGPVFRGGAADHSWGASGSCASSAAPTEVFARWCGASLEVITANFASTEIAGDLD